MQSNQEVLQFISVNGVHSVLAEIRNDQILDFLAVIDHGVFVDGRGAIVSNPMLQEISHAHCCGRDYLTASVVFVKCFDTLNTRGVFVKESAFADPFALTANRYS